VTYLLETLPLGGGSRHHVEVLREFRLLLISIFLLGVLLRLEGHLRPLRPLARLSRGWRLSQAALLPQGPLGLPGVIGLVARLLGHLYKFLNINYIS
jgi:hypothetical protein